MKQIGFICCALLAAGSFALRAESITNGQATLEWKDGVMEFTAKDAPSAKVTFAPSFTNGTEVKSVTATVFTKGKKAIMLHGKECCLTFVLVSKAAAVRVSTPRNAAFTAATETAAVVVADSFGEDAILEPGKDALRIPGFIPFFMGLQGQENWTLSCIPYQGRSDITLSADLKTWGFQPQPLEEYTFVIQAGNGIWKKIGKLTNDKGRTEIDWKPPFPASYRAAFPLARDFCDIGEPRSLVWKVGELRPNNTFLFNRADRVGIVDVKAQTGWSSGFYGTFAYPAYLPVNGKLQMVYPRHSGKQFAYDRNRPIYLYTYSNGANKPQLNTPINFMDEYSRAAATIRVCSSIGTGPATCGVTHGLEKLFRGSEPRAKRAEIVMQLAQMQVFVESIRARINLYREWAKEMKAKCLAAAEKDSSAADELKQFAAGFDFIEQVYKGRLRQMKTPEAVLEFDKQLLADIDNKNLDDEELEKRVMKFGRDIRGIGGNQDNCVAQCRYITKTIRLQALHGYMRSSNPTVKAFYREVYLDTCRQLRNAFYHEGK